MLNQAGFNKVKANFLSGENNYLYNLTTAAGELLLSKYEYWS